MEKKEKQISAHDLFPLVKELLAEDRQAVFRITGASMLPFLGGGRDRVWLENCDVKSLKKGDIILFQLKDPPHDYILHRVHRILEEGYLPWGDGNLVADAPITPNQIVGKVVQVERKGKLISCTSRRWRLASAVWRGLTPIKPVLLRMYRWASRVKRTA